MKKFKKQVVVLLIKAICLGDLILPGFFYSFDQVGSIIILGRIFIQPVLFRFLSNQMSVSQQTQIPRVLTPSAVSFSFRVKKKEGGGALRYTQGQDSSRLVVISRNYISMVYSLLSYRGGVGRQRVQYNHFNITIHIYIKLRIYLNIDWQFFGFVDIWKARKGEKG